MGSSARDLEAEGGAEAWDGKRGMEATSVGLAGSSHTTSFFNNITDLHL